TSQIQAASAQNLVITEVMGNPCNGESRNEYVELYNFSSTPVSLQGLWITDGDAAKAIVPWADRSPSQKMGSKLEVATLVLEPHHFAVILAPEYGVENHEPYRPYLFPPGTVILTVDRGRLLTDDQHGIEVTGHDPIVLYLGTRDIINEIVSTYGSPRISAYPLGIQDDGKDNIPFRSKKCWAAERIEPINQDKGSMWREVKDGTPGYGDYGP
ncbi:MAG: lamin tail domain-containing protein, partial [Gammaproteobacteria bacterium]|nr:lamin tail domain-containing protein [Gammaproteobacteria bacterium]